LVTIVVPFSFLEGLVILIQGLEMTEEHMTSTDLCTAIAKVTSPSMVTGQAKN